MSHRDLGSIGKVWRSASMAGCSKHASTRMRMQMRMQVDYHSRASLAGSFYLIDHKRPLAVWQ